MAEFDVGIQPKEDEEEYVGDRRGEHFRTGGDHCDLQNILWGEMSLKIKWMLFSNFVICQVSPEHCPQECQESTPLQGTLK